MALIDRAWKLQNSIDSKIKHWASVTIGFRFFASLLSISFLAYAGLVTLYFTFLDELEEGANFFTTCKIPVVLNPITVVMISIFLLFMVGLDMKGKL